MICPECQCELASEAESFLHQRIHAEPLPGFGQNTTLRGLSGLNVKRLAQVMTDYAQTVRSKEKTASSATKLLSGALRQATFLLTLRLELADITDDEKFHLAVFREILGSLPPMEDA